MYYGSWKINDTPTFVCNTHTPSTGAAADADANPGYAVFEDETTNPIITGSMAKLGDAHTVGFYSEQLTLSAANGFEKGKSYNIYISATVGGIVGTMSHFFQIEAEVDSNVVSDKTGYSLSSPQAFDLNGNITGTFAGNILGSVQSVTNPVTAGNVTGTLSGVTQSNIRSAVGMASANLDDQLSDLPQIQSNSSQAAEHSQRVSKLVFVNSQNVGSSGNSPTQVHLDGQTYPDDGLNNYLLIVEHTGTYHSRWIEDWVLSTEIATVNALPFTPSSPDAFWVFGLRKDIGPVTAGMVTGSVLGNVNGSVGSVVSPVGISTGTFLDALADKVWDEAISGHLTAGSVGNALNAAGSAGDPWSTPLPGSYTAGQAGHILASRMPTGTVLVGDKTGFSLSSPQSFDLIGNISGTLTNVLNVVNPVVAGVVTGSVLGNVNGSVGSVVSPVGISTGSFIFAIADQVWDEQLSAHQAAGSAGNALSSAGSAGDPWSTPLPGSYTAGQAGHILASRMPTGTVIVGTNQDKTGYSLSTPQAFDLIGNISGTLTNVLNVVNPVTAGMVTGSVLGNVNGSVGSVLSPVGISTGSFIGAIADGVWDEAIAGHLTAGSTGEKLNSAGSAGDPWGTALPGSYVAGTAGHILASRMPTGTVIVGSNQDKTGYSLSSPQTINIVGNITGTFVGNIQGNVSGSVGSLLDIGTTLANKIADFIWRRTYANIRASSDGDAVSFRSPLGMLAKLVNKWSISGATLTVKHEDDSTTIGTQTLTGTAGADPITQVDTD